MQVIPPETKEDHMVYSLLKHDEYWTAKTIKRNVPSHMTEVIYKYSEGEKAIVYDTFRFIDRHVHPNYDKMKMSMNEYLKVIYEECNRNNTTWGLAIKRVVYAIFDKHICV